MCSFIFIRQRSDRWEGHTLISRSSGGFQYHFWFVSLTLRWFRENICNRVCFYFSAKIIHTAFEWNRNTSCGGMEHVCLRFIFSPRAKERERKKCWCEFVAVNSSAHKSTQWVCYGPICTYVHIHKRTSMNDQIKRGGKHTIKMKT